MDDIAFGVLRSLAYAAPSLLVFLAGCIVAVVKMPQCRTAASLALAGCALLLLVTVGSTAAQQMLIANQYNGGADVMATSARLATIGIGAGVMRSIAYILLLSAVFVDRRPTPLEPQ